MRSSSSLVLATVALALLCALPAATAQSIPRLSVTPAAEKLSFSTDAPGTMVVVIRLDGTGTGTPLDSRHVNVAVDGAPADWTAAVTPSSLDLAPGQSASVELRVTGAHGETRSGVLTVKADTQQRFPDLSGAVEPTLRASAPVTVERTESVNRQISDRLSGPWLDLILIGFVGSIVLLVVLVMRSRRPIVSLGLLRRDLELKAGGRAYVDVEVRNLGPRRETIKIEHSEVPKGWDVVLTEPEVTIEPDGLARLELVVRAPAKVAKGVVTSVLVSATAARGGKAVTGTCGVRVT